MYHFCNTKIRKIALAEIKVRANMTQGIKKKKEKETNSLFDHVWSENLK